MPSFVIKGKSVILRPLSLKDAPNFCFWLSDMEVTKFLGMYEAKSPSLKEEKEWIKKKQKSKKDVVFSIVADGSIHIGTVSLIKIDKFNKKAEFGIMVGDKKYWGQGYGTEAGRLMVDYGFRKLKLNRIYLRYIAYNIRGEKSYKKIGFRPEGKSRQNIFRDSYFHDEFMMGILRSEWLKENKKINC